MINTNIIENAMVDCYRDITRQQRIEVLTYIRIRTDYNKNSLKVLPYVINLENTRIDLQTGKKLEFTPDVIEFDRIPIQYNEHALSFALEGVLMDIFCHDQEVRSLFEEMMGYCLMKHCKYNKAFILYGSGANGKSTILHLLKKMLGCSNYSSIELERLNDALKRLN